MLAKAIAYAAAAHEGQVDKQGEAYILHPMRVVLALRAKGFPEVFQVVAVLHDTVEDTPATLTDIEDKFGKVVRDAVDALTKRVDSDGKKLETYKESIARCCTNVIARQVKRFDINDNADPTRFTPEAPYDRYVWALKYIEGLRD